MKAILWTLLQWGAKFALPLALILISIYGGSFYLVQRIKVIRLPKSVLVWIWAIGFIEIIIMGSLYHLTPKYFPDFLGEFFFIRYDNRFWNKFNNLGGGVLFSLF